MPYAGQVPGQPYPGGGYAPVPVVEQGPRVVPETVRMAFFVMLAGAVVTLLSAAYMLTTIDQIREEALDASGGVLRGNDLDVAVYAGIGGGLLTSAVSAGLWVWMAFACRAGKNWARITSTVFFGINVLFSLIAVVGVFVGNSLGSGGGDVQSMIFTGVTFLIGLGAVVLLWQPRAAAFFAPPVPPGYQPYPPTGPW
ncbi:hypothetical protein [Nocardia asteroides]|uniref:hypothetical protein n=1 Tax=Nocardia asteroides TaxID=1824 RepID=UPI001E2BBD1E|nr:hypothetical protein [Nocardia asteroides]UGT57334.1 hypothetical protein LTT85_11035 [Nocardia asteroides]